MVLGIGCCDWPARFVGGAVCIFAFGPSRIRSVQLGLCSYHRPELDRQMRDFPRAHGEASPSGCARAGRFCRHRPHGSGIDRSPSGSLWICLHGADGQACRRGRSEASNGTRPSAADSYMKQHGGRLVAEYLESNPWALETPSSLLESSKSDTEVSSERASAMAGMIAEGADAAAGPAQ